MANIVVKSITNVVLPYTHTPSTNTAAIIGSSGSGQAEITNKNLVGKVISWSYDDAPANGSLIININGTQVYAVDIIAGGPGFEPLGDLNLTWSSSITFTLSAGGGTIQGRLNLIAK